MALYVQEVLETRVYKVLYYVNADNASDAADKVAIGETVKEIDLGLDAVIHRDPADTIEKLTGSEVAALKKSWGMK